MENEKTLSETKSELTLLNRNKLNIGGVKKIKSSAPEQVVLVLSNCAIVISGTNLFVVSASIQSGEVEITGLVGSIRYTGVAEKKRFSLKNMFK